MYKKIDIHFYLQGEKGCISLFIVCLVNCETLVKSLRFTRNLQIFVVCQHYAIGILQQAMLRNNTCCPLSVKIL